MNERGVEKGFVGGMSTGGPVVLAMDKRAAERFDGLVPIDMTCEKASPAEAGRRRGAIAMVGGATEERSDHDAPAADARG